jgi:small-conductance mechanosensitive channel
MKKLIDKITQSLEESLSNLLDFIPELALAIVIFVIGHFIIRKLKGTIRKRVIHRSGEALTAQFTADIIGLIFYLLLLTFCINLLGFDSLTSKLIAGAGLTAFIIGFALKDIGENFLSGIILVFNRPFRTNDIIEIDGIQGQVLHISLRETIIKTADGRDVYIPNADILKKPLHNYTIDDQLRDFFIFPIFQENDISAAIQDIHDVIDQFPQVLSRPRPIVQIQDFDGGTVNIRISYWYDLEGSRKMNRLLRSEIMLAVFERLRDAGVGFPNHVQDISVSSAPE